jgi:hypothetical protein
MDAFVDSVGLAALAGFIVWSVGGPLLRPVAVSCSVSAVDLLAIGDHVADVGVAGCGVVCWTAGSFCTVRATGGGGRRPLLAAYWRVVGPARRATVKFDPPGLTSRTAPRRASSHMSKITSLSIEPLDPLGAKRVRTVSLIEQEIQIAPGRGVRLGGVRT